MFSGTIGYYGYYGTTIGYYTVPVGTTVLQGTTGYYGYYGTTAGYYVVPADTMVVPEMGTIRVL